MKRERDRKEIKGDREREREEKSVKEYNKMSFLVQIKFITED